MRAPGQKVRVLLFWFTVRMKVFVFSHVKNRRRTVKMKNVVLFARKKSKSYSRNKILVLFARNELRGIQS